MRGRTTSVPHGFTLLESLIALSLLTILLLGLSATQITALRQERLLYYSLIASQQEQVMYEMLASIGGQDPTEMITLWNRQNEEVLPGGSGVVDGVYPDYKIRVDWGRTSRHASAGWHQKASGNTGYQRFFTD